MDALAKYSLADWIYGIVASVIGAVIFAAFVFVVRWIWRWLRSFSAQYRRDEQKNRIIKLFVYRRYLKAENVLALSRGHFFVLSRCLQFFILGFVFAAMGFIISWLVGMQIPLLMFGGLSIWMFVEAASWLDPTWSERTLNSVDEQALSAAAAILSETPDEIREQVVRSDP